LSGSLVRKGGEQLPCDPEDKDDGSRLSAHAVEKRTIP